MTKNLLKYETSPYLLQHQHNPVYWYPWGDDAFKAAKKADKPILLSIGYAACHWCHVMAHESFEDQITADLMNDKFINIKIDREEYPDVDKLYMDAIHAFGERGGWPLTVFLEPDGTPFWGGTYFPKEPQYGRPGFKQILSSLAHTWQNDREKITTNKEAVLSALNRSSATKEQHETLTQGHLLAAANQIVAATDQTKGGLSGAPKFPQTTIYGFLWRMYLKTNNETFRQSVLTTLTHICQGGIYDHLAGGFARYSVDDRWLAPHFEKMLYDNALIVDLLTLVYRAEENVLFRKRIEETVQWLFDEMITVDGTFAASYDADSEGEEGTYYVWSYQEVLKAIPAPNQKLFCETYDISESGNWEGKNIPNRLHSLAELKEKDENLLTAAKELLLAVRTRRQKPGWDDKTLADWNGLAIAMLCNAGFALSKLEWIKKAEGIYIATKKVLWKNNVLFHSYRQNKTTNIATADDYANLIKAAISLFEATNNNQYLNDAESLAQLINEYHWNKQTGGYYFASSKAKNLVARSCNAQDDATPNANGTMLVNLEKLYHLTGHTSYDQKAHAILKAFSSNITSSPMAFTGLLTGFINVIDHIQAIIILPKNNTDTTEIVKSLKSAKYPLTAQIIISGEKLPVSHPAYNKTILDGKITIYLCKGNTCSKPITETTDINNILSNI